MTGHMHNCKQCGEPDYCNSDGLCGLCEPLEEPQP